MMTDLNALVVFAKVVDSQSFSEAARRMKMPVSTVSRRVAELEEQLGVRLLERSTRSLRLTDIGSEILSHARVSAEISSSVDDSVRSRLCTVSGRLGIAAASSCFGPLMSAVVKSFQEKYPEVRVESFISDRAVDYIDEGIDLAFTTVIPTESNIVARKITSFRSQLVATPAYVSAFNAPRSPKELANHRLIAYSCSHPERAWKFFHANKRDTETIAISPQLWMNDAGGFITALLDGRGVGNLSMVMRSDLLKTGRLIELMPEWQFPSVDLSVVHLGNRHIPPTVRAFKDFAAEEVPRILAANAAPPMLEPYESVRVPPDTAHGLGAS